MDTWAAAAAVTGARHLRAGRNGQDAAVAWLGAAATSTAGDRELGVVVVCDGCGSGPSSEVGARLGASLFAGVVAARLRAGESPADRSLWESARAETVRVLADLVERVAGDRVQAIHDCLLFTIVAGASTPGGAAVWALGDGAYSFGDRTRVLGPFDDNAPPYLGYDLLGEPRDARFETAPASCGAIVVATDGASDLEMQLEAFAVRRFVEQPDALRRQLAVLARSHERIVWDERRVARTPARLQDDCAIAVLRWSAP
jgi:hypothetical protein